MSGDIDAGQSQLSQPTPLHVEVLPGQNHIPRYTPACHHTAQAPSKKGPVATQTPFFVKFGL